MEGRPEIERLCAALADGLARILGGKLCGLYVYGAAAFPETGATGDVDFHAILGSPPTDADRTAILALHAELARDFPPLGAELDGYYLLLADARRTAPPAHLLMPGVVDDSWALHRAHILAGRCIVLRGPDPRTIYPPASWPELETALQGELDYVIRHLGEYPEYCVLNLCRLMYSFETRDVVTSKWRAAGWASALFPSWRELIDRAKRSYARQASDEDRRAMSIGVKDLLAFARERISDCRTRSDPGGERPWRTGDGTG